MKKLKILFGTVILSAGLASCSSAYYASAGYASDDLYAVHDRAEISRRKQAEAEAQRAAAEARRAEWEARIAEAKAAAAENSYYEYRSADANPYESVLADDYESAYARRLRGFESPTYKMPSSYINARYGSAFNYVSAYDPAFYNIVVMGDQVWVEPKYITSMFGSWGTVIYSDPWYYGWNRPWGPSFSFGSWGWSFGWNSWHNPWYGPGWGPWYSSWYDPWYGPGWGWGPGWHGHHHGPGWGPGWHGRPYQSNIVRRAQSLHVAFGNPLRRGIVFRLEIDRVGCAAAAAAAGTPSACATTAAGGTRPEDAIIRAARRAEAAGTTITATATPAATPTTGATVITAAVRRPTTAAVRLRRAAVTAEVRAAGRVRPLREAATGTPADVNG